MVEVYLMKKGVSLSNIKEMSEVEVMEYFHILQEIDEYEVEKMQQRSL